MEQLETKLTKIEETFEVKTFKKFKTFNSN
jgi:hypothetical protein